jgi:hypothetical protein
MHRMRVEKVATELTLKLLNGARQRPQCNVALLGGTGKFMPCDRPPWCLAALLIEVHSA